MPEVEFKTEQYGVDYVCDECGGGDMKPNGPGVLLALPPKFPHKCDACGHEVNLQDCYPLMRCRRVVS